MQLNFISTTGKIVSGNVKEEMCWAGFEFFLVCFFLEIHLFFLLVSMFRNPQSKRRKKSIWKVFTIIRKLKTIMYNMWFTLEKKLNVLSKFLIISYFYSIFNLSIHLFSCLLNRITDSRGHWVGRSRDHVEMGMLKEARMLGNLEEIFFICLGCCGCSQCQMGMSVTLNVRACMYVLCVCCVCIVYVFVRFMLMCIWTILAKTELWWFNSM